MELANDELSKYSLDTVSRARDDGFKPTPELIFRSAGENKMALYQIWKSEMDPHEIRWIPVPFIK